ncbi:DUF6230 family protein [Paludifilum halophilum]|uniref:Uncharacterized protein n=1 Tax=Paludifilum halophilum TaxID=1642702 RepID=A0A235B432_9BACL|nr:DUF6230 family protein [Paludifilum halophilum]OYD06982.1 hypothetical protein CHM34_13685 [Paludifilum halophilum]
MKYRGKLFWISLTVSMALLLSVALGIYAGGVAMAVPLAGVGGFYIEADRIEIRDFKLLPEVGETSEKKAVPQVATQMDADIKGLKLYKDLNIPGQGKVRVLITASGVVKSTGMVLDMTKISADHSFKKLTIKEEASSDFRKKFGMDAPHLVLKDPKIQAHYLFNNSISLPGMKLEVQKLKK